MRLVAAGEASGGGVVASDASSGPVCLFGRAFALIKT